MSMSMVVPVMPIVVAIIVVAIIVVAPIDMLVAADARRALGTVWGDLNGGVAHPVLRAHRVRGHERLRPVLGLGVHVRREERRAALGAHAPHMQVVHVGDGVDGEDLSADHLHGDALVGEGGLWEVLELFRFICLF